MDTTSVSLIRQVQLREPGAWDRFQSVYEPLLRYWVQRDSAVRSEADDLIQDLLFKLHEELPRFERQRVGSFRRWLRVLATNRVREFLRKRKPQLADHSLFEELASPTDNMLAEWDAEYDRQVVAKLLSLTQSEFEPNEWALFLDTEIQGTTPREAALAAGLPVGVVYRVRYKILRRLKEIGQEMLEKDHDS